MGPGLDELVARPVAGIVPAGEPAEPLRILVPSLAQGGAERIVIEWLSAEILRGRVVELAVLHRRHREYRLPSALVAIRRGAESVESFVDSLGGRWRGALGAVSVHLVPDALLARLWARGIRTVPVIHNTREGWRNDPASWREANVPLAVACAASVGEQASRSGCRVPIVSIRHRPATDPNSTDPATRQRIRAEWNISPGAFVVGVVGAFKVQKDHGRAVEVIARLQRTREATLVIVGGALDASGLAELERVTSRAAALGLGDAIRLPGFVDPVGPWYAAFDVLLNVSRHEGLSMATREALAAGLPVVATDVGGQGEIPHRNLHLLPAAAPPESIAARIAGLPVRASLARDDLPRFPRAWSLSTCWHLPVRTRLDTLFVTANLNAGGAQRSLANLACGIAGRHRFAIAVCAETTHTAFPERLSAAGIECFRPAPTADPFEVAEGILARATRSGARSLCFWNADPKVKLLVARFAPPGLRIVDVSPGAYAYEELESAGALAQLLAFAPADYYCRLDCLVTKFSDATHPPCRRVETIRNGVALRSPVRELPPTPRFLVCGRIAPSKRLETILDAFRMLLVRFPGSALDIVGQAEPRHRDYLASLLGCVGNLPVAFRGACPDLGHLSDPYTAAIVLGTKQGCPNAVLEAMSAGVAVIANDSGGTGELVRHGETGWLLSQDCPADELALALADAARDAQRARRLGEAGRERAIRHHGLEDMALRYLSILDPHARIAPEPQDAPHGYHRLHPA